MKRRISFLCVGLTAALLLGQVFMLPAAASDAESLQDTLDDLQDQVDSLEDDQSSLQDSLTDAEDEVDALEEEQAAIQASVEELDAQYSEAVKQLTDVTEQEEAKQAEIDASNADLEEAQKELSVQYENMKLRIRYMYEQSSISYLSILFSAEDATQLLTRAEYISSIYRYDRQMLEEYEQAKAAVEEQQTILAQEYAQLEELRAQAEEQEAAVEALLAEKNAQLEEYAAKISETQALADQYQQQLEATESLIAQLEASASATSEALNALLEAEAEDTSSAEAEAAQAVLASIAASEEEKLAAEGYDITVDPNTLFVWPCPSSTTITSDYGYRIHPIYGDYRFHSGIDISASTSSAIIAAYQGTVIGAGYNSSMGNYVMIDHGEGLVTIYMHASYLCVSEGDSVETGQLIALVGATGDATGPHLHFSVRLNGTYVSPWNYVSY